MTAGQSSNQYNFTSGFSNTELLFDAFERTGKSPAELTQTMLASGRRSLNLILQSMASRGPALWAIELYQILLQPGVPTITLPANISSVLDVYIRQYSLTTTVNEAVNFSTIANSVALTIYQPNHNLTIGQYVNVVTPVSIGGTVVSGYYPVTAIVNTNNFQVTLSSAAVSTVSNGGVVPQFTSTRTSSSVEVYLPNNGISQGSNYSIPVSTTVGGIDLIGSYLVTSVIDSGHFIISTGTVATSTASAYMNGGLVQLQEQTNNAGTTDRILYPMSRTDYNSLPYKLQQGFPYTFWYDRVIPSTMTFWQVPDQNGPYVVNAYCLRQLQDANLGMGEIPDIQYRALEMITARLAMKLAVKYAPDKYQLLKAEADEEFNNWASEEREKVPLFFDADVTKYFRG